MLALPFVLALTGCISQFGFTRTTDERVVVVPDELQGWVVIEYRSGDEDAPSTAVSEPPLRVPASGRVQVSTQFQGGPTADQYRRDNGTPIPTLDADRLSRGEEQEETRPVPFVCCGGVRTVHDVSGGGPERVFEYFYVGTGPAGAPPTLP